MLYYYIYIKQPDNMLIKQQGQTAPAAAVTLKAHAPTSVAQKSRVDPSKGTSPNERGTKEVRHPQQASRVALLCRSPYKPQPPSVEQQTDADFRGRK